jgi:hypothetical protein
MFTPNMQMYDRLGNPTKHHCGKYQIGCNGTIADKEACPEWGYTIAAEEYFENQI